MVLTNLAWDWLEQTALRHACIAVTLTMDPDHWVELVAYKLHELIISRAISGTINPHRSLHVLPGDISPYQWTRGRKASLPENDDVVPYITQQVVKVLQVWLGYPMDWLSQQQSWFVGFMVHNAGEGVLLLGIIL